MLILKATTPEVLRDEIVQYLQLVAERIEINRGLETTKTGVALCNARINQLDNVVFDIKTAALEKY